MPTESADGELLDTQEWLLRHMAALPHDDLGDEFQRGYLCGMMLVYEAHPDADLDDLRYRAAVALEARMALACLGSRAHEPSLRH